MLKQVYNINPKPVTNIFGEPTGKTVSKVKLHMTQYILGSPTAEFYVGYLNENEEVLSEKNIKVPTTNWASDDMVIVREAAAIADVILIESN